MNIKTSNIINRKTAIDRIKNISKYILSHNYRELERLSDEEDGEIERCVYNGITFDSKNINKWTNKMLERVLNKPVFRWSVFKNYIVKD